MRAPPLSLIPAATCGRKSLAIDLQTDYGKVTSTSSINGHPSIPKSFGPYWAVIMFAKQPYRALKQPL
jgi:hypothetical protein